MKKVKIAQIGTNGYSHGNNIWSSLRKQSDLFEIVGYALPENEREKFPERMPAFEGYREMTVEEIMKNPEIEAVAIETDEIYLTKYAQMAADHGKHIHMEKPGGTSLDAFEKLIETVKHNGKVFHTGYMYRYNPMIKELMEKIKSGELGEIISVEAQMSCYRDAVLRQWLDNFPGGMMFYLGCHLADLILQIQGKPERIIPLNKKSGADGVDAEDFGMAVFEYKNGISFAKTIATEVGGFARRQLVVSGTKGTVEIKPLEMYEAGGQYTLSTEYSKPDDWGDMGVTTKSDIYDRYDEMISSFGDMVLGKKKNPWSYDYELELYRTVLKCCGK